LTHSLGRFILATGTIPAGSSIETTHRIITAGKKPIEVQYISFYGGDEGESMQLILVPPNTLIAGGPIGAVAGALALTANAYMAGAQGTVSSPMGLGSDNGGRGAPRFASFIIPPFAAIVGVPSASNAVEWNVTVGGFELN